MGSFQRAEFGKKEAACDQRIWKNYQISLSLIPGRKSQANNVCVKTTNILLSTYYGSILYNRYSIPITQ